MSFIEKKKQEKDNKYIGKRYIINYDDIIPSYKRLSEAEDVLNQTILEYKGKGIYVDLITQNIVADSYKYNIYEEIDFQFDLFDINQYLKEIGKQQSELFLESITEKQKEKVKETIFKVRINTLKNTLKQIKTKENKVKSLQK